MPPCILRWIAVCGMPAIILVSTWQTVILTSAVWPSMSAFLHRVFLIFFASSWGSVFLAGVKISVSVRQNCYLALHVCPLPVLEGMWVLKISSIFPGCLKSLLGPVPVNSVRGMNLPVVRSDASCVRATVTLAALTHQAFSLNRPVGCKNYCIKFQC